MTAKPSISPPHRESSGRKQRPSTQKAEPSAVNVAAMLEEIRRQERDRRIRDVANNPARKGEIRALMGGLGEAVIAYENAFTLMQKLVNGGGLVEASALYFAGTRYMNLWTEWRGVVGLPLGFVASDGPAGAALEQEGTRERAEAIWGDILKAEHAIEQRGSRALWVVRHVCRDMCLKADMSELSPNDTIALVNGLHALHTHWGR